MLSVSGKADSLTDLRFFNSVIEAMSEHLTLPSNPVQIRCRVPTVAVTGEVVPSKRVDGEQHDVLRIVGHRPGYGTPDDFYTAPNPVR